MLTETLEDLFEKLSDEDYVDRIVVNPTPRLRDDFHRRLQINGANKFPSETTVAHQGISSCDCCWSGSPTGPNAC